VSVDPKLVQSVRQRLTDLARKNGDDVQRVLIRYAIERLLYRLSQSPHKDTFVLKGATLFSVWEGAPYRSTVDLDLLGRCDNQPETLSAIFKEVAAVEPDPPDGLAFETSAISAERIRPGADYAGVSLRFEARLGRARLPIEIDIGFGDAITPRAKVLSLPSLLDQPAARLKTYPPETVIAEKVEAMVSLGLANSRLKDLYDVWAIAGVFDFDGEILAQAIGKTFKRRKTALTGDPPAMLTDAFVNNAQKQAIWRAFLDDRAGVEAAPRDLATAARAVAAFLDPVLIHAAAGAAGVEQLQHGAVAVTQWRAKARAWEGYAANAPKPSRRKKC